MVRDLFRVRRVSQYGAALAALVLLLSIIPVPPADAAVEPVVVAAQEPAAPVVVCMWALPDMDLDATTGMQYADGVGHSDDNPSLGPAGGAVCTGGDPNGRAGAGLVQVIANPADAPSLHAVELWAAIDRPGGIGSGAIVYWDVFYPDGNFKVRVNGTVTADECASLTLPEPGDASVNAVVAAVATGQMDVAAADALQDRCRARVLDAYTGVMALSFNEPCGAYAVETHALGAAGETVQTSTVEVDCFQHLAIDTAGVDWGTLTAGTSKVVNGDFDLATGGAPTLVNIGSGGLNLGVRFAPMIPVDPASGVPVSDGVAIDQFGAVFGTVPEGMQRLDPLAAGADGWFDGSSARTMCAGDFGRLDLLIYPPELLSEGSYQGSFESLVRPDGETGGFNCNNDEGVYGGSWFDGDRYVGNQRSVGVAVARPAPLEAPASPPAPEEGGEPATDPIDDSGGIADDGTGGGGGTVGTTGTATTTTTTPAGVTTTVPPKTTTTTTTPAPTTTTTTTVPKPGGTGTTTTTTTTTTVPAPPPPGGGGVVDPPVEPELTLPRILVMPALDGSGNLVGFEFGVVLMESDPADPDAPEAPLGPIADLTDAEEQIVIGACYPLLDVDMDEDGFNDGDLNRDRVAGIDEIWIFYCGSGLDLTAVSALIPGRLEELGIPILDDPDTAIHPPGG